jgi:streptogramin lyase
MKSTKKLAMAALLALGLLALFAGPASAMKYSLNIAHPEGLATGTMSAGGMATDSAGNLYIAEPGKIEKFSSSGKFLSSFVPTGLTSEALDVDVDAAGNIWAISTWTLNMYSPTGTLLKKIALPERSFADAVSPSGVTFALTSAVAWGYNSSGTAVAVLNTGAPGQIPATDIDIDSSGRAWAATRVESKVRSFDSAGKLVSSWSLPTVPAGLAADNGGNVWAAEPGFCRIRKYSSTGTALESFGECSGLPTPGKFVSANMPHERPGIAWGPGGVVWVSNGTEVQKWIP